MPDFSTVEDTLFVPMLGRIYASENFPHIFEDKKALSLKEKLPANIKGQSTQTQYTLMAGAVRSGNMDRYIRDFIRRQPDGVIVELGCGLETAFYRNDNGENLWYEVDLPNVIDYRSRLLGSSERDLSIASDAFSEDWIRRIRSAQPDAPLLITASGLLYYFGRDKVMALLRMLKKYGTVEVVFDAVNAFGIKQMRKYMKQVGHADAAMYFYVDSGEDMAREIGASLLAEEPYYAHTEKRGLQFITAATMRVSDLFRMVKMIHIQLNGIPPSAIATQDKI